MPQSSSPPEVTVIVPTFNRWKLLRRALASALAQVDVDLEVIVVDDGSADETPMRLAEVHDERLTVLTHEVNRGVAAARNRGLEAARAPWVAFLDDDDFWAPTRLREHVKAAHTAHAGWTFGSFITFIESGAVRSVNHAVDPGSLHRGLYSLNQVGTPSAVTARTDLVREAGGFDSHLSVLADWDLWLRLKDLADAAAVKEPLLAYAAHPENMQSISWSTVPDELRHMTGKYADAAEAAGVRFGQESQDRWMAQDHRRFGRRLQASSALLRVGLRYGSRQDILRAAVLLLGEDAMSFVSRRRRRQIEAPPWLREGLNATPPMSAWTDKSA